jgi:DNA-binding response OmpR family regulator
VKLLCLSHDESIAAQVLEESRSQSWLAEVIRDRSQTLAAVQRMNPDLVIVDVHDQNDLEWWRQLKISEQKPVLFMNEVLTEEFVVKAFDCGADGLIPKSLFSRRFLVARVNAYLRRQGLMNRRIVPRLGLVLDSQRYKVEVQGTAVPLTLTEFKILRELAKDEEQVVLRRDIQSEVFGTNEISKRSLDVHVCSLRKKLRPFKLDVDSVRGVGYRLAPCAS